MEENDSYRREAPVDNSRAMEVTMAQLNSLGDYITQQIDALAVL